MGAATPVELGLFLEVSVNTPRAQVMLDVARNLITAETGLDVDDWPGSLWSVHLAAAARGYTNPASKVQETVGSRSYSVSETGVFLTTSERRTCAMAVGGSDLRSVTLERRYCP